MIGSACRTTDRFDTSAVAPSQPYCDEDYVCNPIHLPNEWPEYGAGDPYILRHDGRYYLYVSSKGYYVGIRVWSSSDLVNWSYEGPCTDDDVSIGAYAPEVHYWNGTFYLYTSPSGYGHYIYTSDAPTGPFLRQTENVGLTIDGSAFVDEGGVPYFLHAGAQGIQVQQMDSLLAPRSESMTLPATNMGHWTEGPMLFRKGRYYFLIYTGNHVFSEGYRVNYSWSAHSPLGPYETPEHNPVLISTTDNYGGLGHACVVRGPDLDSFYMAYHNLNGPAQDTGLPVRYFNINRLAFNGSHLSVLFPATSPVRAPRMADWQEHNPPGESGTYGPPEAVEPPFTTETWFKFPDGQESDDLLLRAVWAHRSDDTYAEVVLDGRDGFLRYRELIDGETVRSASSELYAGFRPEVSHSLRVVCGQGDTKIVLDDVPKLEVPSASARGRFSIRGSSVKPSFMALSRHAAGSSDRSAEHVMPGSFEAVHGTIAGDRVHTDTTDGVEYVHVEDETVLRYAVNVTQTGRYAIDALTDGAIRGRILINGEATAEFALSAPGAALPDRTRWVRQNLGEIILSRGRHALEIRISGESETNVIRFFADRVTDSPGRFDSFSWLEAEHDHYIGMMTAGDHDWRDYRARIDVDTGNMIDSIGLLFRISNESEHLHQTARAYCGYCLLVHPDRRIELYRNAYERQTLLGSTRMLGSQSDRKRLSISCRDGLIVVRQGFRVLIRIYDPNGLRTGRVGVQSSDLSKRYLQSVIRRFDVFEAF